MSLIFLIFLILRIKASKIHLASKLLTKQVWFFAIGLYQYIFKLIFCLNNIYIFVIKTDKKNFFSRIIMRLDKKTIYIYFLLVIQQNPSQYQFDFANQYLTQSIRIHFSDCLNLLIDQLLNLIFIVFLLFLSKFSIIQGN